MHKEYNRPFAAASSFYLECAHESNAMSDDAVLVGRALEEPRYVGVISICHYSSVGAVFGQRVAGPEAMRVCTVRWRSIDVFSRFLARKDLGN